jgi:hypothetical protein
MQPEEEWRPVKDGDAEFEASNLGNIRIPARTTIGIRLGVENVQCRPPQRLSPWVGNNGYLHVAQQRGGKRTKHLVHRLVARAWVPGEKPGLTVNHVNGAKLDNLPSNLEWITKAENTAHQWRTGLVNIRGERHPSAKLRDAEVVEIRRRLLDGHKAIRLAKDYGVSDALIYKIGRGKKPVVTA